MLGSILIFLFLGLYYWSKGDNGLIVLEIKIVIYPLLFLFACYMVFSLPKSMILFFILMCILVFSYKYFIDKKNAKKSKENNIFALNNKVQQTLKPTIEKEKLEDRNRALISAREEYKNLKRNLSKCPSTRTYNTIERKRIVIYTYKPISPIAAYICTTSDKGITSYYPNNEYSWEIYFSELKKLCNSDNIFIRPIIRFELSNMENTFPFITVNKSMSMYNGAHMQFKCSLELDNEMH